NRTVNQFIRDVSAYATQFFQCRSGFGNKSTLLCDSDDPERTENSDPVPRCKRARPAIIKDGRKAGTLQRPRNHFRFAGAATPVGQRRMNRGRRPDKLFAIRLQPDFARIGNMDIMNFSDDAGGNYKFLAKLREKPDDFRLGEQYDR